MTGRRITYLLSLLVCWIFFTAYRLWFSWFALMAIMLLPLFSLTISLPAMLTARLEIDNPPVIYLGTQQELVLLYGSRRMPTPPWRCKIRIDHSMTGRSFTTKEVEALPTGHCGQVICTVRRAWVYDYLGLIGIPMRHNRVCRSLVRPTALHPGRIPDPENHRTTAWRPKPGGGFAENHELRLYRPGDSVQQIHWKLSAKTGQLILREPMEPIRGRLLLRLDLTGDAAILDEKLGKLLWISNFLLEKELPFQLQCLTGNGVEAFSISNQTELWKAIDALLRSPKAQSGSLRNMPERAAWQYHIGGGADEP